MVGRLPERWFDLSARLKRRGPHKLLAIDCGGIRSILSLKILDEIEQILIKESRQPDCRLADYFISTRLLAPAPEELSLQAP